LFSKRKTKFEAVVLVHLPSAYNLARWLVRSPNDADDVVQDACLRAYQHFEEFRGTDARPWLLAIVRNAAFALLRKHRIAEEAMRLDDLAEASTMIGAAPGADVDALKSITLQELHASIDRLPAAFKEMIVLRDMEGLSYLEIASITQIPVGTVMSRLSRARKHLRGEIVDLLPDRPKGGSL
jgi:RNA polymerase sigma factor (sigma-70 family)